MILISLDTLRPDRLGCYGYARSKTPNVDALAAEGILFENAYAHASHTLPSHATLFTSLYPLTHQVTAPTHYIVPSKFPLTMTELFKKNGYRTAAFTGGGFTLPKFGFGKGFDSYLTPSAHREPFPIGSIELWLKEGIGPKSEAGKPFFIFLHTYEIHSYTTYVRIKGMGEIPASPISTDIDCISNSQWAEKLSTEYDAGISRTDASLGALYNLLKDAGLYENSIILLISDHGESFCEWHGNNPFPTVLHVNEPYEEQIRVPMVLKLPPALAGSHGRPGARFSSPVGLIDVAPTLMELCGIKIPRKFQGRSLVPLLQGAEVMDRPIYASNTTQYPEAVGPDLARGETIAILRQHRKYIHHPLIPEKDEFYDLKIDPHERTNLIEDRSEEAQVMLNDLKQFAADHGWNETRYREEDKRHVASDALRELRSLGYLK